MKFPKKTVGLSIIVLSAAISIFLIGKGAQSKNNNLEARLDKSFQIQAENQPNEKLEDVLKNSEILAYNTGANNNLNNTNDSNNATEKIVKKIAQDIINKNSGNPSFLKETSWLNLDDPNNILSNSLVKEIANFDTSLFNPKIKYEDLKISPAPNIPLPDDYLLNVTNVFQENYNSSGINSYNISYGDLKKAELMFENILTGLYKITVSDELKHLHLKQIQLVTTLRNILQTISSSEDDPFLALVAINALGPINQEFTKFNQELNQNINGN